MRALRDRPFRIELSIRAGAAASWQTTLLKLVLHPLLMAALVFWLLPVDPLWAKIAVVCASLRSALPHSC